MGKRGKLEGDDYVVQTRRGGKAGSKGRKSHRNEVETSDAEDDLSSFVSNLSYQNIIEQESLGDGSAGESGIEDNDVLDQQFDCSLEGAAVKNTVVREKNLKIIREMLSGKILGEVLFKRKMEVVEIIEKSLKHGKSGEKCNTSHIAVLYALQAGMEEDLEELYTNLKTYLISCVSDANVSRPHRAKILLYLASLCFLCSENIDDRKEILDVVRDKIQQTDSDILIGALSSLSLILTICTPTERKNQITLLMPQVRGLLTNSNVDVRIEAGEVIAHMFQLGRDYNPDFDEEIEDMGCLIGALETLATDAAKYRAKKDRKQQRSSFREILSIISGEGHVHDTIRVSLQETLQLNSWSERVQYHAVRELLGSSTSLHLQQSVFVREIFGLGPPPLRVEKITKAEKHEQKKLNAACHKARQKNMAKHRDKRMIL